MTPRAERSDGHLFCLIDTLGVLAAPDRLAWQVADHRPAESSFVLTRASEEGAWRYPGVARWLEQEQLWAIPPVHFATWRARRDQRGAAAGFDPLERELLRYVRRQRLVEFHAVRLRGAFNARRRDIC